MKVYYMSITGNVRRFVHKIKNDNLEFIEMDDNSPLEVIEDDFIMIVPTYLEGGNGIDNGDQEILTEVMRELLEYRGNYKHCKGIIGSGNKNFGYQYCLTAKQYCEQFKLTHLMDFELAGTSRTVEEFEKIISEMI